MESPMLDDETERDILERASSRYSGPVRNHMQHIQREAILADRARIAAKIETLETRRKGIPSYYLARSDVLAVVNGGSR